MFYCSKNIQTHSNPSLSFMSGTIMIVIWRIHQKVGSYQNEVRSLGIYKNSCREKNQTSYVSFLFLIDFSTYLDSHKILLYLYFQAFLVEFYSRPRGEGSDEAEHIGMCYIYPDNIKQTSGCISVPITSMKF